MSARPRTRYENRTSGESRSAITRGKRASKRCAGVRAALEALEVRRLLTTFPVTTMTDGVAGSLRAAIVAANGHAGPDIVTIPAGTYTLTLTGANEDACATGDL